MYKATNNTAEYEALITGIKLAIEVCSEHLKIFSDSQLVVNQVKGLFVTKDSSMVKFVEKVNQLLKKLE